MATWHQQQAMARNRTPLWHETQWTVCENPPNDCMTLSRFETEATAKVYIEGLRKRGLGQHCRIIPPMRHQMRKS